MKDFFSEQAKLYATFRPNYPKELYEFIFDQLPGRHATWDCATGSGQVAQHLANHFDIIYGTDISEKQLANAHRADNIHYSVSPAEKTTFSDHQFDLITVAQALHWFNLDDFYREAIRVGKNSAILAIWGYNICTINPNVDAMLFDFYHNVVGPYWDSARRHVENEYADLPFPFKQVQAPKFNIQVNWTLDQFMGYITTWSATQKFISIKQTSPALLFKEKLKSLWDQGEKKVINFPVFLKVGVIQK